MCLKQINKHCTHKLGYKTMHLVEMETVLKGEKQDKF